MNCGEFREFTHASLDRELGENEEKKLRAHLSECEGCRRYHGVFDALKSRLGEMVIEARSPGLESRIGRFLRRLGNEPPRAAVSGRRPRFTYAAAAAVLMASAVILGVVFLAPGETFAESLLAQHRLRAEGKLVLDAYADCCRDMETWFRGRSDSSVHVPEINFPGLRIEGGKLFRHVKRNELFYVAYCIGDKPVSLFICCEPRISAPCGEKCRINGRDGHLNGGGDYTMVTWRDGESVLVLVTPFDKGRTLEIFASVK